MIEINGVAHIALTVSHWDLCRPFYEALLPFLGLKQVHASDSSIYYVGGRTAVGVGRCAPEHAAARFEQGSVGLHHMCFRARTREDVDAVHGFVVARGAKVIRSPEEGPWAPGYYSTLFEDPAGVRIPRSTTALHLARGCWKKGPPSTPAGTTAVEARSTLNQCM